MTPSAGFLLIRIHLSRSKKAMPLAEQAARPGDQMLFDAEDEGRAAAGKLQRWGLEAAMAVMA